MSAAYINSNNLQENFRQTIAQGLQTKLGIKNPMDVPMLSTIIVNMGVKEALSDKKSIQLTSGVLAQITGQKAKVTRAKKSIATFKLREGEEIGVMVTLRGKRMYDFFTRLTTIILPRIRDFHGTSTKQFDGHGNYALGFSEYTVFPEIDPGKMDKVQGLQVVIKTTAKDDKEGVALLEALGMPFIKSV